MTKLRYTCQATQLPYFTTFLPWWDMRQYLEDYTSGNVTLRRMFLGFVYISYYHLTQAWRIDLVALLGGFTTGFNPCGAAFPTQEGEEPYRAVNPLQRALLICSLANWYE